MTPFLSMVVWNTLYASLLAVLVGCLAMVPWFRRRPAAMQVLWMLVLAKFVAPAFLSVPFLPARAGKESTFDAVASQRAVAVIDVSEAEAGDAGESAEAVPPEPLVQTMIASGNDRWAMFLISFSCVVSVVLVIRSALHGVRFHRWLKSVSRPDSRLERLLELGRIELGISQSPAIRSITAQCVPFLWAGGRRACIYVPQTVIETLDDGQLTGVLCHELVHHARKDAWSSLFASVVTAACWWNPLVWWARRQLRLNQELCCDARVLELGGRSRRAYAETLLTTLELVTSGIRLPSAMASSWGDDASLKRRFQMIGDTSVVPRLSARIAFSAILCAIGLLCLPVRAEVESPVRPHLVDVDSSGADKNREATDTQHDTAEKTATPLYIHFIGNTHENASIHLLTRRVGPTGGLEEDEEPPPPQIPPLVVSPGTNPASVTISVPQELTGRVERRGKQYFVELEYHLPIRDGYFKGEITLDKPAFPVYLAASSVIYPVIFIVSQNPDPAPYLNQPFFKKGADRADLVDEPDIVVERATQRIVGRITSPDGKPLANQQIVAAVLPGPPKRAPKPGRRMEWKLAGEVPPSATSDEQGRFTIENADPKSTILLQFYGAELQQPREWRPKGSIATTITLEVSKDESELEVGYVPRNMTTKNSTIDGKATREVAITWSPTTIKVLWAFAPSIEKWKESRTLAQARDTRWKDDLFASDEIVWEVLPAKYHYNEHNQHIDFGSALQLGIGSGQGLRVEPEKEIILFVGAHDPRTKVSDKP